MTKSPLPMGFSRQAYWRGLPFPSPGDPPDLGIKPVSPARQAVSLPLSRRGSPSRSPGNDPAGGNASCALAQVPALWRLLTLVLRLVAPSPLLPPPHTVISADHSLLARLHSVVPSSISLSDFCHPDSQRVVVLLSFCKTLAPSTPHSTLCDGQV